MSANKKVRQTEKSLLVDGLTEAMADNNTTAGMTLCIVTNSFTNKPATPCVY